MNVGVTLRRACVLAMVTFAGVGVGSVSPSPASAQVNVIVVPTAPPPIPYYVQPYAPGPGRVWIPGYWAWGPRGYYWVWGTWVYPPAPWLYWTPGYWSWNGYGYYWCPGYWGYGVGYYGGVNYGYGYYGNGYVGGRWHRGRMYYNSAVTRVNPRFVRNVYRDRSVVFVSNKPSVSYNGGPGGTVVQPTLRQRREGAVRWRSSGWSSMTGVPAQGGAVQVGGGPWTNRGAPEQIGRRSGTGDVNVAGGRAGMSSGGGNQAVWSSVGAGSQGQVVGRPQAPGHMWSQQQMRPSQQVGPQSSVRQMQPQQSQMQSQMTQVQRGRIWSSGGGSGGQSGGTRR